MTMSEPNDIAQIITALASLIAAAGSAIAVVMSVRQGRRIEDVHRGTNGMSEKLLKITGESEHAKGVIEGRTTSAP